MLVSAAVVLFGCVALISAETLKCQMVPFETKEGLSGTCCVFFKNSSDSIKAFPQEDVAEQILNRKSPGSTKTVIEEKVVFQKTDEGDVELEKEVKVENSETVKVREEESDKPARKDGKGKSGDGFVFPDRKEQNSTKEWKPATPRSDVIKNDKGQTMNVTTDTRNAFDVPERCPDGTYKDHTGGCSDPF